MGLAPTVVAEKGNPSQLRNTHTHTLSLSLSEGGGGGLEGGRKENGEGEEGL